MRPKVTYHFKNIEEIETPKFFSQWLKVVSSEYNKGLAIQYIFCNDDDLIEINRKYLNHDTYTDIITFDLSSVPEKIIGEIYISVERVKENAKSEGCSFADELMRVMSHGVFHLLGHGDKTDRESLKMRELENSAIQFVNNVSRETKG